MANDDVKSGSAGSQDELVFLALGGLGEIGRNCMAIEQEGKVLLIDCGLMFPDADMHGIDLVLPDFTWLRQRADDIVGVVATHGHEDHVGALQYLLRELSFPIYGSAVTLGLARNRIEEAGLLGRTELVTVKDGERRKIGPFDVEFIPVTHSVPHGFATAFHTPQGTIMHTGDWKLDLTPVDGRRTDLGRIGAIASTEGIYTQDRQIRTRLAISAVADKGQGTQTGSSSPGRRMGLEMFDTIDPKQVGLAAAKQAVTIRRPSLAANRSVSTLPTDFSERECPV